jgi:DNA replication protein DnaC
VANLERWKKAGLFVPYFGKEWDNAADADALHTVQKWVENFKANQNEGLGLLIMGDPGRGKTLLAHMAADGVLDAEEVLLGVRRRDVLLALTVQGYLDLFRRQMDCMDLVRKTGDEDAAQEYMRCQQSIEAVQTKIKVVLIDDIGKEHTTATGYAQHQIERLVRARGNRGLPTILTTNLDTVELADQYGESFLSYMLQVCSLVPVSGKDHRRRNGSPR